MNQPISRQLHGLADYSYIPLTLALPKLAGFEDEKTAVLLTKLIAGNVTLSTLFTRAEWGVFRLLPFKAHLALDVAVGTLALGAPWLLGFARNKAARNAFLALGVIGLTATALTRPEEMPAGQA
jgi:hypothetical protein